jgi:hypothetical protein
MARCSDPRSTKPSGRMRALEGPGVATLEVAFATGGASWRTVAHALIKNGAGVASGNGRPAGRSRDAAEGASFARMESSSASRHD